MCIVYMRVCGFLIKVADLYLFCVQMILLLRCYGMSLLKSESSIFKQYFSKSNIKLGSWIESDE